MLDETEDANGDKIAALIIGSLDDMKIGPFVVFMKKLKNGCDTAAYTKFVIEGLNDFYPNGEYVYLSRSNIRNHIVS